MVRERVEGGRSFRLLACTQTAVRARRRCVALVRGAIRLQQLFRRAARDERHDTYDQNRIQPPQQDDLTPRSG